MIAGDRDLRLFWLAIAVPAAMFALGGLRLLQVEARRAGESDLATLRLHAGYRAEKCISAVRAQIEEMLVPLADLDARADRLNALRQTAKAHPFVKNFSVWRDRDNPPPHMRAWERRLRVDLVPDDAHGRPRMRVFRSHVSGFRRYRMERERGKPPGAEECANRGRADGAQDEPGRKNAATAQTETGVGEWTVDGKPRLLGWVKTPDGDNCTLEIDPAEFFAANPEISALGGDAGAEEGSGDGRSVSFALTGPGDPPAEGDGAAEVSLAPLLKDWRVRAAWKDSAGGRTNALVLAGGCLLALLVCSLFAGGALLVRDVRRQRREALLKTDFVSNVSHELKTPLTAIRLWTELMSAGRLKEPDGMKNACGIILSETERLSRLVGNLLDFGRLERKKRRYDIQPVQLRQAAAAAVSAAGSPENVKLADGPEVAAAADPDAVRQILVNLLDNAAKYAPGAETEISAGAAENGRVFLRVADAGQGIPEECMEKIFERFYRVDDSVTAGTGGSGLGLAIARSLARGMHGDLTARKSRFGGAEFTLALPAAAPGETPQEESNG